MGFSIFEIGMLVCFGLSWPINIYKSLKSRTAKGKSLLFLAVIILGYISGIINKILYSPDIVLWLYVLNLLMVSGDLIVTWRNKRLDKQAEAAAR